MSANLFPGMKDVLCIWLASRQRAYSKFLGNTATSIGTKPPADGRLQAGLKQRFCAWGRRGVACQICTAEAQAAHPHQGSSPSQGLGETLTSGSQ